MSVAEVEFISDVEYMSGVRSHFRIRESVVAPSRVTRYASSHIKQCRVCHLNSLSQPISGNQDGAIRLFTQISGGRVYRVQVWHVSRRGPYAFGR